MTRPIESIVIVGGGSSGWMSASYLKKSFPKIDITVIEAPTIPRIGVGEATIPNLQTAFWDHLGVPEEQWMRRVNASFKMGIKFVNWAENPQPGKDQYYYHLFGVMPNCRGIPLSHYWAQRRLQDRSNERLDYTCYKEPVMSDAELSPRFADGKRATFYAWHFDAQLLANYLQEISLSMGVKLIPEQVNAVSKNADGFLTSVHTTSGHEIEADMFLDCTGLRSTLMEQAMGESFIDMSDYLLCDSAVATQLPYSDAQPRPAPYTTATALQAGWCWNIPLLDRFGTGYVHSSRYTSMEEAILEFSQHLGVDPDQQQWNRIRFRVGRMSRAWTKNCVAIGLASNFLEPLESTALYLTYGALYQLCRFFPDKNFDERLMEQFNAEVNFSYDDCRDFVQMHYATTRRTDSAFWLANQHELKLSDSLQQKLRMYRAGLPVNAIQHDAAGYYSNFEFEYRNFWTNGSYYCVLAGIGMYPEAVYPKLLYDDTASEEAERMIADLHREASQLSRTLPTNYEFLKALHAENSSLVFAG
jgi:tryptophan halogenase